MGVGGDVCWVIMEDDVGGMSPKPCCDCGVVPEDNDGTTGLSSWNCPLWVSACMGDEIGSTAIGLLGRGEGVREAPDPP